MRPNKSPVTVEMRKTKKSRLALTPTSFSLGMSAGTRPRSTFFRTTRMKRAAAPPRKDSNRLSVSS
jgi:hypothetical protein